MTEKSLTDRDQKAWFQELSEDFLSSINAIDTNMLGKIRMMIYIIYDPKHVWVKYDPNSQKLEVLVTFKWFQYLFRRNKVITNLATLLHEKFPNLDIEVMEFNGEL